MKDYLNNEERNQIMVIMAVLQMVTGEKKMLGVDKKDMLKDWSSRNNLTKEEHKSLKFAQTYLKKFCESIYKRMGKQEQEALSKKIARFDFRLVDDYTLQKVCRDLQNRLKNAVVPREQFGNWCRDIMEVHCKGCTKHYPECELHTYFENNFIPESTWGLENCRYAYKEIKGTPKPEKIKGYEIFKEKRIKAV
jgi:hypothetical protein